MKKIIIALTVCCCTVSMTAQKLLSKIPENATIVVTIKGENVIDLLSIEEFSNSEFGKMLDKEIIKESDEKLSGLSDLGLDFSKDFHYFMEVKDRVFNHCFLIPLKDSQNFLNILPLRDRKKIITEGNVSYIQKSYGRPIIMWNTNTLIVLMSTDEKLKEGLYSSDYNKSEDTPEKTQEERAAKKLEFVKTTLLNAKNILAGTYAKKSILTNSKYTKSISNKNEEASVWMDDFFTIYQNLMPSYLYGGAQNPYSFLNLEKLYGGTSMATTLDFKDDEVVLKTEYTMNNETAKMYKPMYKGKINKNFTKYINEDHLLGYMSVNTSTEGILNAYPNILNNLFRTDSKETLSESVALGTKLFSMLIDEKTASKIIKGDMLLILTDLAEREVTYTDYKYDEEYNYTKVEKTKTETVPDFMFMFTSEEEEIYNRLTRIALNENELISHNGVYEIKSIPNDIPFNIYITYKDNIVFMGSALKDITAIQSGTFVSKLSRELKNNITKNASSVYVNGKKIISEIPAASFPRELRDKVDFLTSNTEDITLNVQKMKGNTIKGKLSWRTPTENHKNSLVYFINMIDGLMK